jgi:hypothetical protein
MLERDRPAASKSRSSPRDDKVFIDPIHSFTFFGTQIMVQVQFHAESVIICLREVMRDESDEMLDGN